jgi:hypothetical protein
MRQTLKQTSASPIWKAGPMNVYIPGFNATQEGNRVWVWSAFVGIRKDYQFMRSVNGNVQILYNVYDDHDNSPYLDRLNVRMGWDFPVRKKQGKQDGKRR